MREQLNLRGYDLCSVWMFWLCLAQHTHNTRHAHTHFSHKSRRNWQSGSGCCRGCWRYFIELTNALCAALISQMHILYDCDHTHQLLAVRAVACGTLTWTCSSRWILWHMFVRCTPREVLERVATSNWLARYNAESPEPGIVPKRFRSVSIKRGVRTKPAIDWTIRRSLCIKCSVGEIVHECARRLYMYICTTYI